MCGGECGVYVCGEWWRVWCVCTWGVVASTWCVYAYVGGGRRAVNGEWPRVWQMMCWHGGVAVQHDCALCVCVREREGGGAVKNAWANLNCNIPALVDCGRIFRQANVGAAKCRQAQSRALIGRVVCPKPLPRQTLPATFLPWQVVLAHAPGRAKHAGRHTCLGSL